jgi:hypothetical protein
MAFDVVGMRDGLTLSEDGVVRLVGLGARSAIEHLYGRVHAAAFDLLRSAGWLRLHGAVVDLDGGRVVIVGESGAGKSTLVTRLLFDGADVLGDEWALVRDGEVTSFARRIHLQAGSAAVIPELAERWGDLDGFVSRDGLDTRAIDPTSLGRPWRLDPAPLVAVVALGPRVDGPSRLTSMGDLDAVRMLLSQTFADDSSPHRGPLVRSVCEMVAGASCWTLEVGDLATVHEVVAGVVVRRSR